TSKLMADRCPSPGARTPLRARALPRRARRSSTSSSDHKTRRGRCQPPSAAEPQPGRPVDFAKAIDTTREGPLAESEQEPSPSAERGKTVHGELANAGHRVLGSDDAEVEAYLEVALDAPAPTRAPSDPPPIAATVPEPGVVAILDFGSPFAQLIARRVRELNVYSELL